MVSTLFDEIFIVVSYTCRHKNLCLVSRLNFAIFQLLAIGSFITYLLLNHHFGYGVTVTAETPKSTVELLESNIAI